MNKSKIRLSSSHWTPVSYANQLKTLSNDYPSEKMKIQYTHSMNLTSPKLSGHHHLEINSGYHHQYEQQEAIDLSINKRSKSDWSQNTMTPPINNNTLSDGSFSFHFPTNYSTNINTYVSSINTLPQKYLKHFETNLLSKQVGLNLSTSLTDGTQRCKWQIFK
ncbi:unnamed protein product [Heterobilharzia americana]|nr:unnamed protein product [Heterobilharzia americana]